jgi:hypothetical protein
LLGLRISVTGLFIYLSPLNSKVNFSDLTSIIVPLMWWHGTVTTHLTNTILESTTRLAQSAMTIQIQVFLQCYHAYPMNQDKQFVTLSSFHQGGLLLSIRLGLHTTTEIL